VITGSVAKTGARSLTVGSCRSFGSSCECDEHPGESGEGSQPFPPDVMTGGCDIVEECSAGMNTRLIRVKNALRL